MVSASHDEDGKVIGWVEWRQVGQSGHDKYHGEYVWIQEIWIHRDYRGSHIFYDLIDKIMTLATDAKYAYFTHAKYNDRMSKLYTRKQFEKLMRKVLHGVD